jgi:hypothetical protein|tara:strand:+ start:427 stop:843 length:417 start_codon:yes stop_codon:yes gene_type:complete
MIQVSHVPAEYINTCWKDVEKYLKGAADRTNGRYEIDDLYLSVCEYGHLLWIAFDKQEIKGAVITNVIVYPKKKFLCMGFCGGKDLHEWKDLMLDMLKDWAKDNKCDGIEAVGRKGWSKVFKQDGHTFLWDTFELPID